MPPFGTADSESRVVDATYEIETATTQDCPSDAERCTVEIDLSGRLPNEVAEFDRYRAEALLLVNGIEGHQFSPSTLSVPRVCKLVVQIFAQRRWPRSQARNSFSYTKGSVMAFV